MVINELAAVARWQWEEVVILDQWRGCEWTSCPFHGIIIFSINLGFPMTTTDPTTILHFSSYPDLCHSLKLPVKTGRAKQNQMKNLSMTYAISLSGRAITLTPLTEPEFFDPDLSPGRGVFGDRKTLFLQLVWERLQQHSKESEDSDAKHTMVFFPEEIYLGLNLVQENFSEAKITAKSLEIPDLLWAMNEITTKSKSVVQTLFGHLYLSRLVSGFPSYRLELEDGGDIIGTPEDALLITQLVEKLLEDFNCKSVHEVFFKNKEKDYFPELKRRMRKTYGVCFFEECYVVTTSKFLLSRYMKKNLSEVNQKRVLSLKSNKGMVESLEKRMNKEIERMYLAASGWAMDGDVDRATAERAAADLKEQVFVKTVDVVVIDRL